MAIKQWDTFLIWFQELAVQIIWNQWIWKCFKECQPCYNESKVPEETRRMETNTPLGRLCIIFVLAREFPIHTLDTASFVLQLTPETSFSTLIPGWGVGEMQRQRRGVTCSSSHSELVPDPWLNPRSSMEQCSPHPAHCFLPLLPYPTDTPSEQHSEHFSKTTF